MKPEPLASAPVLGPEAAPVNMIRKDHPQGGTHTGSHRISAMSTHYSRSILGARVLMAKAF